MNKSKIMIIDEQPFFRTGVRQVLSQFPDFEVIDSDPNNNPLGLVESAMPDIVLLGSDLAAHSGLELSRRITRTFPSTRVIILSPDPNDEQLFEAIRTAAVACLKKNTSPNELVSTIRRAARGEYPINESFMNRPTVAKQVLKQFQDISQLGKNIDLVVAPLTNRERQILNLVAGGNTNKQIARILDISEQTIKNHVSAILRKLNANDRAHAVVLAIRHNMISIDNIPESS
jgi:DNA-binding NarL/FixJ family response regulator